MITIYKHTNTSNGKCYVGKTKKDVMKRWEEHVVAALRGSELLFHRAIRKYSPDSWTHETLEVVKTTADANLCESKWINQLRSNDRNCGYNMTSGGDGGQTSSSEKLSRMFKNVPKTPEHKQHMRESQERYWANNPSDPRRDQLIKRNKSPEMIEASRQAQHRRWSKPGAKETMKALWQNPEWRAKTLEARRQAKRKRLASPTSD